MSDCKLYFFNPTCETAIANGSETYMATQILREFEEDLSLLPMVFATENDYVLSSVKPSEGFIQNLKRIGFPVSKCVAKIEIEKNRQLKFSKIIPWGWSPAAHFQLDEIKKKVTGDFRNSVVFNWQEEYKTLFERKTSAEILKLFLSKYDPSIYCFSEAVPEIICSEIQIGKYLLKYPNAVLKSPVSSSGRGVQMIRDGKLSRTNSQWANAVFKQMGYLMAEPLHQKKLDFSFQFKIDQNGNVTYLGHVFFFTNGNGMYQGHYLNRSVEELTGFDFEELLNDTGERLRLILKDSKFSLFHEGFLGVDGMIIDENGTTKVHPCVEINCRLTMGMLALRIQNLIHSEAKGRFEIFSGKEGEFAVFSDEMKKKYPIEIKDQLFYSGFAALTEPREKAKFGAYVLLG